MELSKENLLLNIETNEIESDMQQNLNDFTFSQELQVGNIQMKNPRTRLIIGETRSSLEKPPKGKNLH